MRDVTPRDRERVLAFLDRDRLMNVYLASRILDEGLEATPLVEIRHDGETLCFALTSPHVAIAFDESRAPVRPAAMELLAGILIERAIAIRAIIGPAGNIDPLWRSLEARVEPPTVVRLSQPVYALEGPSHAFDDLSMVRPARLEDLDLLVPACASMHFEEIGIDPLIRDASGYRRRIRELVLRGRSFVVTEQDAIRFKAEVSASTPHAVQLMGVWTAPSHRRQGLARRGLSEICGYFLRGGRTVTLFVNDFNEPAIQLYESLGFRRIGENRALIW